MESVEHLHKQLDRLDDLRTIVKTMKALSAASIRQYELAVAALDGYARSVTRGLYVALRNTASAARPAAGEQAGVVVFGSDHGLCGRFNEAVAEHALDAMAAMPAPPLILAVGTRAAGSLEHAGRSVEEVFLVPGSAARITDTVQQILMKVDQWQSDAGVSRVWLFYNGHAGGRRHEPRSDSLLPVDLGRFRRAAEVWPSRSLPIFTMERDRLLSRLVHQYLFVSVFRACAESQASEHASRLAAMQSAEHNLDERLQDVAQEFRRARQTVITAELLDVVGGFEAIAGGDGNGGPP